MSMSRRENPTVPTMARHRRNLSILAGMLGLALWAAPARAGIVLGYENFNPTGPLQSVNFLNQPNAITVVGDTNPNPQYNVDVTSLEGINLNANGSNVENGDNKKAGFSSISIAPQAGSGYNWTFIDFRLDSTNGKQPLTGDLTLTAYTAAGGIYSASNLNFPWNGNNGENQDYYAQATGNDRITKIVITYTDSTGGKNTIQDIHNIDVKSAAVPEPGTLALMICGSTFALGGVSIRRRRRAKTA